MTNDVFTREWSKDVMTPQNPLGVAGWAVPGEDEDDHYDDITRWLGSRRS